MGIRWINLWVRLKPRPSSADLIYVISGWCDFVIKHPDSRNLAEHLDQHYPRAEWVADLKRAMTEVAEAIAAGASRREQARLCRRELLCRIEMCAKYKSVLALDKLLFDCWLAIEYADKPWNDGQRANVFLVKWAFGPLVQGLITGLYVSQYNSTLSEGEFSDTYQLVCQTYNEVLAKTVCVRSGDASFIYPAATAYDDLVSSQIEPKLRQLKERLAAAVEMDDLSAIRASRLDAVSAFKEYQTALDHFNTAVSS